MHRWLYLEPDGIERRNEVVLDFEGIAELEAALAFFGSRERRFGLTREQLPTRAGGGAMKVGDP